MGTKHNTRNSSSHESVAWEDLGGEQDTEENSGTEPVIGEGSRAEPDTEHKTQPGLDIWDMTGPVPGRNQS